MAPVQFALCTLLLLSPVALSRHDDDFAFDNNDDFQEDLTENNSIKHRNGLKRLWGVPDTAAYVGHLFRMEIPKEAFSGDVSSYKVRCEHGHLPSWLAVDSRHGLITGIPQTEDLGAHSFTVTAHNVDGVTASDTFTVEVRKAEEKPQSKYGVCRGEESRLVLVILIGTTFGRLSPRQRIRSLMDLASFMALDGDEFSIAPLKMDHNKELIMLMSGPGNRDKPRGPASTAIYLNVGCGDKLWPRHKVLVSGLREQARDGTLGHVLRLPVYGWRLVAEKPPVKRLLKRQLAVSSDGSGNYEYDGEDGGDDPDYSGDYDDADYGKIDAATDAVDTPAPHASTLHPHRHHHGEDLGDTITTPDVFQTVTELTTPPPIPTPLTTTQLPTTTPIPTTTPAPTTGPTTKFEETTPDVTTNVLLFTAEDDKVKIEPYPESSESVSETNINTSRTAVRPRILQPPPPFSITPEEDATTTETETQTVIIRASNEIPSSSTEPSPSIASPIPSVASEPTTVSTTPTTVATPPTTSSTTSAPVPLTLPPLTTPTTEPTTTSQPETTVPDSTTQETELFSERSSPIFGRTTETVSFTMPTMPTVPAPVNQPPTLKHHMKKLAITAGKAFRYIIPADLFTDPEDGTDLTFTMYEADNVPLNNNSWIQFMPAKREVYGLPLEAHVSRWNFIVEAKDSQGEVARGPLDITVQQHKSGRTINHKFFLQFQKNKTFEHPIDWQISALEGIVNLFRDTDMDHLTVLNATQNGDLCEFVWTNDTLPKDPGCPKDDIARLMKIMESQSEPGAPSPRLVRAMSPELVARGAWWRGAGPCEADRSPAPAPAPGPAPAPAPPSPAAPDSYPPVTRNQVDHLTATVGHLLVYKVPEDTFYDPEDGNTRRLSLSLRYSDRSELPRSHWLQFDANNQEFYGLPGNSDLGSNQYQLVAEDSTKKSAYDSLLVEVVKAPTIRPTVEFQMTLEYPYPQLAYNANNKRKVVEKLAALFGQVDTDSIRIQNITDNPTTIIWYNTSLPMDRCPEREIEELRKMIIVDERNLRDNVDQIFDKDLKVMSIRLILLGLCAEQNTKHTRPVPTVSGTNRTLQKKGDDGGYTEYLVTFIIPAVVVVCMILVAGVVACVLYRRRRTGKMSVGDEEERQAFRSKGIPVIFQDELEEQAGTEPLHKSPVIMREEKPPLLPPTPDYRNSAPYRPPPPVAPSTTPPRPKATPTYRKPPPYVPP